MTKLYKKTINSLYDHYKLLENVNKEVEKLTKVYLINYVDRKRSNVR